MKKNSKRNKSYTGNNNELRVNTLIGDGVIINGNINSQKTIRVDGIINGNCKCMQEVIVGTTGKIIGDVSGHNIIISGSVEGDISANGKLEMYCTGNVHGDILAKSLVIDENAKFDGRCTMLADTDNIDNVINFSKDENVKADNFE